MVTIQRQRDVIVLRETSNKANKREAQRGKESRSREAMEQVVSIRKKAL